MQLIGFRYRGKLITGQRNGLQVAPALADGKVAYQLASEVLTGYSSPATARLPRAREVKEQKYEGGVLRSFEFDVPSLSWSEPVAGSRAVGGVRGGVRGESVECAAADNQEEGERPKGRTGHLDGFSMKVAAPTREVRPARCGACCPVQRDLLEHEACQSMRQYESAEPACRRPLLRVYGSFFATGRMQGCSLHLERRSPSARRHHRLTFQAAKWRPVAPTAPTSPNTILEGSARRCVP
jgi:hypothetical protein